MDRRTLLTATAVVVAVWYFMPRWFKSNLPRNSFTMYYADWCPHCSAIKPEFDAFSFSNVVIRSVEEKENNEYKVKGYPTFVFTNKNGWSVEYSGQRSAASWVAWLRTIS